MHGYKVATTLGGTLACAAGLPALGAVAPAGDEKRRSANAPVASQYLSRGLHQQTWGKPTLRAGLGDTAPGGFYAGVWGSRVRDRVIAGGHAEIDTYLGHAASVANDIKLTTGLYCYWYPSACYDQAIGSGPAIGYDYKEWMVGTSCRGVSVKLWTKLSNDFGFDGSSLADGIGRRSCGSNYAEANWSMPLTNHFTLGLQSATSTCATTAGAFSVIDCRFALSQPINQILTLSAALTGADAPAYANQASARNAIDRMTLGSVYIC